MARMEAVRIVEAWIVEGYDTLSIVQKDNGELIFLEVQTNRRNKTITETEARAKHATVDKMVQILKTARGA